MILNAEMQTVGDKTVISGQHWSVSDQYRLLITVGGVGGDFSQTDTRLMVLFPLLLQIMYKDM